MPAKKEDKPMEKPAPASSGSSDSNIIAAIAYILGPVIALIIYLIKKDDRFVRFHSMQSLLFGVAVFALFIVFWIGIFVVSLASGGLGGILGLCMLPLMLVLILVALYLAYMAFSGKMYKLPVIGDMAEKYA